MPDPNLSSFLWSVADLLRALDAHHLMSTQALNSPAVQRGIRNILLNHARLWETLREEAPGP